MILPSVGTGVATTLSECYIEIPAVCDKAWEPPLAGRFADDACGTVELPPGKVHRVKLPEVVQEHGRALPPAKDILNKSVVL